MTFRQTTICREGWYYLAIIALVFGGAVLKEVNLLLILAGLLLGPLLLNWRAVRSNLRGLKIERQLPSRLSAGDILSVNLSLANARPRLGCWAVAVEEQIQRETVEPRNGNPHRSRPIRLSVLFPYVEAGQSRRARIAAGSRNEGAIVSVPCDSPRGFPSGCFRGRSPPATWRRSSCCRVWDG